MRLSQLIEELQEIQELCEDDPEVCLAMQPNYPFKYSIQDVVEVDGTVYITEKTQLNYLESRVTEQLGW